MTTAPTTKRRRGKGSANDRACQLCYNESSAVVVGMSRIGNRCLRLLTAIALDAGIMLELHGRKVVSRTIDRSGKEAARALSV